MKRLINISTHGSHLDIIGEEWRQARELLDAGHLHGFEIYHVPPYRWEDIPADLTVGVHLRFIVFLSLLLHGARSDVEALFGDQETLSRFCGGFGPEALIHIYSEQLQQAERLGAQYAVFHASLVHL